METVDAKSCIYDKASQIFRRSPIKSSSIAAGNVEKGSPLFLYFGPNFDDDAAEAKYLTNITGV